MKYDQAKILRDQLKRFNQEAPRLTDIMLVEALNHSVENFAKQGFDDVGVRKWKERKNDNEKGKTRAILVKSGRLRRSIKKRRTSKFSGVLSSNLPYANVHNEGGIIDVKAHKRTATRTVRIRGNSGFVNGKFTKGRSKKMTLQGERHNVSGHAYKMPKRQFVGNSRNMVKKIEARLKQKIDNIFR